MALAVGHVSWPTLAPSMEEIWDLTGAVANLLVPRLPEGRKCPAQLQVNLLKNFSFNLIKSGGSQIHVLAWHALLKYESGT